MSSKHSRMLLSASLLIVGGAALLLMSALLQPHAHEVSPAPYRMADHPTSEWEALPTRALTTVPDPIQNDSIDAQLQILRAALSRGDLVEASAQWATLATEAPNSAALLKDGARLARALGDSAAAEERAWAAIRLNPRDAEAWAILGIIFEQAGEAAVARQALDIARYLDARSDDRDSFIVRWNLARREPDLHAMEQLAAWYSRAYPHDALRAYFRAASLNASNQYDAAISLIAGFLHVQRESPAVLWFALGQAYLGREAFAEAASAFEVAAAMHTSGDPTLSLASDSPSSDLDHALSLAYLGSRRCAEAEALLIKTAFADPNKGLLLERAILCQTPTPTLTPWIPVQRTLVP